MLTPKSLTIVAQANKFSGAPETGRDTDFSGRMKRDSRTLTFEQEPSAVNQARAFCDCYQQARQTLTNETALRTSSLHATGRL